MTAISIISSICSFKSAKEAEQYKQETLHFKDTINLETLLGRFQAESSSFLNKTRNKDWYKGVDVSLIISPFKNTISDLGKSYHLIKEQNCFQNKVHELNHIVQTYDKASSIDRERVNTLILEIIEQLQQAIQHNTYEHTKK